MKKMIALFVSICSVHCFAGSVGGSNPPAREKLEEMLMSQPSFDGGLFDAGSDIGLLTRKKLQPQMLVSGGEPIEFSMGGVTGGGPPALTIPADDIAILRDRTKPIEAIGAAGQNLSFEVLPGDNLGSVTLKDRRLIMRESTAKD